MELTDNRLRHPKATGPARRTVPAVRACAGDGRGAVRPHRRLFRPIRPGF